jgi:hypothetical protein
MALQQIQAATELTCTVLSCMILIFIQKCQVAHNTLLSITLQACCHLHQMTAVMRVMENQ